jgi:ankyrin repeat protein
MKSARTVFIPFLVLLSASAARSDADQDRALREAASAGRITDVQRLIEAHADVNSISAYGQSALMSAALRGNNAVIEALLRAGANPELRNDKDNTALHLAAYNCNNGAVRMLLGAGANVNSRNHNGTTALMNASEQGCRKTVEILLRSRGIDVNARNDWYKTALDYALMESVSSRMDGSLVAGDDYGHIALMLRAAGAVGESVPAMPKDSAKVRNNQVIPLP